MNSMWSLYRKVRITASDFSLVIKAINSRRRPSKSLLKRLLGLNDIEGVTAIQWGIQHEKAAISTYEEFTNQKVQESVLWVHPFGALGGSPDGVVSVTTIIEVKCPYSSAPRRYLTTWTEDIS
ncbi:uncharacterized protein LOC106464765 [Limulus polyphemus]|uniref:Uncharacterized protein LOC106464765 n=1 Tax=Limulus polyphemus TaxID=6850 RepID=A0ABM1BEJ1_LIMPO|nr:uncharacterized protein LOC106464765 [Limulus polyphemus]